MCACNTGSKVSKQLFSCVRTDLEQYKCTRCDGFRTHFLHLLKLHFELNHTVQNEEFRLYRCKNCDFKTWSKYLIVRHRKLSLCVVDKRKFVCVDNSVQIKHDHCYNVEHTGFPVEKFRCEYCLYTTESKESLKSHESECFKFQCGYCSYSTPYKYILESHIKFEHTDFLTNRFECRFFHNPENKESVESVANILQTEHDHCYYKKYRQLTDCDIEQPYGVELTLIPYFHLTPLGIFECKFCLLKLKSKEYLQSHVLTHFNNKRKQFQCKHCPFKSIYKYNFKEHQKLIHNNPSLTCWFKCPNCSFKTQHRQYLRKHQNVHLNPSLIEWFYCDDCSFKTKWKQCLIKHQKNKHSKQFQCEHCTFKTRHPGCLARHRQFLHTDPALMKWFQCNHCFYTTNRKSSLKLHQQTQHNRNSKETLRCKYCSFETYYKYSLKKHLLYKHFTSN